MRILIEVRDERSQIPDPKRQEKPKHQTSKARLDLLLGFSGIWMRLLRASNSRPAIFHQLEHGGWWWRHEHGWRVFRQRDYRTTGCRRANDERAVFCHRRILGVAHRGSSCRRTHAHNCARLTWLRADLVGAEYRGLCSAGDVSTFADELD